MSESPKSADVELGVLIVSYNSRASLDRLLPSLASQLVGLSARVVVVDNASHDGTAEHVALSYPWVRLVRSPRNLGFAAGNNLGFRQLGARYTLLLNPDAIPADGAINAALAEMRNATDIGMIGARLFDGAGREQPSARAFPSVLRDWFVLSGLAARYPRSRILGAPDRTWADPQADADVDWVPGAFALMPSALFVWLGGFDERFFLYYEEVDLCRRMKQAGWRVVYRPAVRVRHIGGESARTVSGLEMSGHGSQLTVWRMRSAALYYRKHHGLAVAWLANGIERGWHALRARRNRRRPDGQGKVAESAGIAQALAEVWRDTCGGRVSPPTPW